MLWGVRGPADGASPARLPACFGLAAQLPSRVLDKAARTHADLYADGMR